ncbi:MAG: glycoside hydrolase family 5 protein [Bacteroidota bacterium]|nr:MAG: glycoside hydrolase family 5 protein [Bacteroidota bacterium]
MRPNFILALLACITFTVQAQTDTLFYGINLAGAEFSSNQPGVYGKDYIYPSEKQLDYYQSKGFRLIRLPFKWERIQPELYGQLDPTELNRMEEFIREADKRNMLVIPDMHNYGRRKINGTSFLIGSSSLPVAAYTDVWKKLATVFSSYQNIWAYGIMNEPYEMLKEHPWSAIAQKTIDAIRTVDKTTVILIPGDNFSSARWWKEHSNNLKYLKDPSNKIVFEAHIYFDKDYSGKYHGSYTEEGAYATIGIDRVKPFVEWLEANNLKGFIGEYGVPHDDVRWLVVLENFLQYLQQHCIPATYWAGGPWWGDYNLSLEPVNGVEKHPMMVVEKYLFVPPSCK